MLSKKVLYFLQLRNQIQKDDVGICICPALYSYLAGWGVVNYLHILPVLREFTSSKPFSSPFSQALAFMIPKGYLQAFQGGKPPTVIPRFDTQEPQQWWAWHNNPKGAVMAWIFWCWPTALYLDLRSTQQQRNKAWYWKPWRHNFMTNSLIPCLLLSPIPSSTNPWALCKGVVFQMYPLGLGSTTVHFIKPP